ncbi:TetR/AcrR family transcriptional regulator [Kitasatospora sp. NBC_01287]|uniref:TetR/AcrR family transcriptional regulator n=1 Tax=Kitasatospora sp. NBC_01287 TaxID=2903573 RepID=UPI00225955F5|nr:TetR/AcrR family transcriptional regulator [Kitasatospora sp. NBC_01287]MCX4747924.1 TetR/AcrR family transcriptional regulator [Kitasatospora sp. NBC_01287]
MSSPRAALIADTAIALIAERGLRGLTHRAVDETADLPPGTTSNHARTRAALLATALDRIAELEAATLLTAESTAGSGAVAGPGTVDGPGTADGRVGGSSPRELLAELLALGVHQALTVGRPLTLARFELALEATRRPELRATYDRLGARFTTQLAQLLAFAGSPDPHRHALSLVRWCEGVLFHAVAGAGQARTPEPAELRAEAGRYLDALLRAPTA